MTTAAQSISTDPPTLPRVEPTESRHIDTEGGLASEFRKRLTIADFERLHELGFIDEDEERFELLDGDLVAMGRLQPPHTSSVNRLSRMFTLGLGLRVSVVVQNPIWLGELSQPFPDLTLARYRRDGYALGHPTPGEVFLVVEVMDSTHRKDRGGKLPLYARAGIAEVWLVDLPGQTIERYRNPVDCVYSERLLFRAGQAIAPHGFPDLVLSVSEILGLPESEPES